MKDDKNKPVLFSCAGCSFAGQLAYATALELDRRGEAEMSCLAGLAARKKPFLKKIEGRPIWMVDGCPIECGKGVLEGIGREAQRHIRLHDLGIQKHKPPADGVDMDDLLERALNDDSAEQPQRDAG